MQRSRRDVLLGAGSTVLATALAGCGDTADAGDGTTDGTTTDGTATDAAGESNGDGSASVGAGTAVAVEWGKMQARLDDAVALGIAGHTGPAASVAADVFARFETANGEWGAHERLEMTSTEDYEGFEEQLGALREALEAGDIETARRAAGRADGHLYSAQKQLAGESVAHTVEVLRLGAATRNSAVLAANGDFAAAATVAGDAYDAFENSPAHEPLEEADAEAYDAFESAIERVESAAESEDLDGVRAGVDAALDAATTGAYAMTDDGVAGAGHLGTMGAQAFDAAALAALGGPSPAYAHAATLTTYRARAHDAAWLAARGDTDTAATMVGDVFAHFEGARAHDGLEGANGEAYETFESGLSALKTAIENGNSSGIEAALATVDDSLVAGIEALAGTTGAAVLQAEFFRVRLRDAWELYRLGGNNVAAGVVEDLFGTFEANEAGFHEVFEDADPEAYEAFESDLSALKEAFSNTDDSGAETAATALLDALLGFETTVGGLAQVSAAQSAYMSARVFDAATVAALDKRSRAETIVQSAFEHFEAGAGGFHEALEAADAGLYESFEADLGAVGSAAGNGGDVSAAAKAFNADAVDAGYAVVGAAGGSASDAAAGIVGSVFESFETATVHDALESADSETYETFEATLTTLSTALEDGSDVDAALSAFATATLRAEFAVVGALGKAPAESAGSGEDEETDLQGGPNVTAIEDAPEADATVKLQAVAFDPTEVTVSVGDTVVWEHAGGEAHNVVAYQEDVPSEDAYFASGGFDSQSAAEEGWEDGTGAVQSGQAYAHTFETAGTYEYFCVPHEAAGMVGTVVVED